MHPAYSVIFFTSASGAGYGLLVWLVLMPLLGLGAEGVEASSPPRLLAHGLAFALVAGGLLASTAHLGRPERAWRAFSQWRTSWLSREGLAAIFTFVPWAIHVLAGATLLGTVSGVAAAAGAVATVWCTGMIYQSLPTIRAWHRRQVTPVYLLLSLATGGTLALPFLAASAPAPGGLAAPAGSALAIAAMLALAGALKLRHWRFIDSERGTFDAGAATGLGRFGEVRVLDPPHTQANFVMREMGYVIARRHAQRLRALALALLFAAPLLCLLAIVALALPLESTDAPASRAILLGWAIAAALCASAGVLVERWLFFAEAQHVVTLFYGARRA